jgi:hypothetical protein
MTDESLEPQNRIAKALDVANCYGSIDGAHHKMWVIDQMVRALTGCPDIPAEVSFGEGDEYRKFLANHCKGVDGPDTYAWDEGIAP